MKYNVSVYIDVEAKDKQDSREKIEWFLLQEKGKGKFIDYETGDVTQGCD